MELVKRVKKFIEEHWDQKTPLLLGYSGGPDSKALLHALLELGVKPLHLAHVDHGWREESAEEAKSLEEEANILGLPFHMIRLQEKPNRNLEDFGREKRLAFFSSLFANIPFQALLLGHHRDDLAETALKRVLEGAHLSHLGGLSPVSQNGALPIWRPLLSSLKREILDYVKRIPFFEDKTNSDPRFLRARLRSEALPALATSFGKQIRDNLALLSERAWELKSYLDERTSSPWEKRIEGSWGIAVSANGLARLEARHLIQRAALFQRVSLSRKVIEPLLDVLLGRGEKLFSVGKKFALACQGWLFLVSSPIFNARKFMVLNNIQK